MVVRRGVGGERRREWGTEGLRVREISRDDAVDVMFLISILVVIYVLRIIYQV